jgi:hypothetical protein
MILPQIDYVLASSFLILHPLGIIFCARTTGRLAPRSTKKVLWKEDEFGVGMVSLERLRVAPLPRCSLRLYLAIATEYHSTIDVASSEGPIVSTTATANGNCGYL